MGLPSLQKAVFKRVFRGKTNIPYKLKIKGDRYAIQITATWKWAFFKGFIEKFKKDSKSTVETPNDFNADPKSYNHILKELKPVMDKIVSAEAKKGIILKLLNSRVHEAKFVRDGEDINLFVLLVGLCDARRG